MKRIFEVHDEITSTSDRARELALDGYPDYSAVFARSQTKGRGRLGRAWESVRGHGSYFSFILRPHMDHQSVGLVPMAAAMTVIELLESDFGSIPSSTDRPCGIKWPNDVILGGRKVCGILCESTFPADGKMTMIIGVGINVSHPSFAGELSEKAISIKSYFGSLPVDDEREYALQISRRFIGVMEKNVEILRDNRPEALQRIRALNLCIGRVVRFTHSSGGESGWGTAVGLEDDGRLAVISGSGERLELFSGEVSVRGMNGYI